MTTMESRRFGFDITVVPDGIYIVDGEKKARISVVFRPNGNIRGIFPAAGLQPGVLSSRLAALNIGLSDEKQAAVLKLLRENPNALITPDSKLPEEDRDALAGLDAATRYAILAGKNNPIRNQLVTELADWLENFPRHLRIAGWATGYFVRDRSEPEPEPDQPALCYIEVEQNPSVVIPVPCDLLKEDFQVGEGQKIAVDAVPGLIGDDGGLDLDALLDLDGEPRRLYPRPHGTTWTPEEAQAVWEKLFTRDGLEDLARSILFPADPGGERSLDQVLARNPTSATVRDDGASQLAAAMTEIKNQELLASFRSAGEKGESWSFAKGLTPGDMVGTIFARLLGTVRPFSARLTEVGLLDEAVQLPEIEGEVPDDRLAQFRQAATVRSLLIENGDATTGSYRIGDLRPGFGTVLLRQERERIAQGRKLYERSLSDWEAAFDSRMPSNGLQLLAQFSTTEAASAVKGVTEAFEAPPGLSLAQDPKALTETEGEGADPNLRAFVDTLAANAMAWRKANGAVETSNADQRAQVAMKRFMELYAHPVLAAAFGLVRDFHIDLDDLPGTDGDTAFFSIGAISAVFLPHNRSAAVIEKSRTGPLAFRPAGRDKWFNVEKNDNDGLSDLTEKDVHGKPRFMLQTLDEQQALRSMTLAAQSTANQYSEGDAPERLDATLPQFRTYGIALMDRWRYVEETDRKAALEAAGKRRGLRPLLLFAETLTIGHRIDIGIVQNGKTIWFDAGDRDIAYLKKGSDAPIPGDLSTNSGTRPELRDRSKAYVTPINRYLDHPDAKKSDGKTSAVVGGTPDIVAQQTLVTWFGRTLSLPRRALEDEFEERNWFAPFINPDESLLPIRMEYYEPSATEPAPESGPSTGVALLAEGIEYFFARRPVFLNRGGPRLSDCWQLYDRENGKGLKLGRSGAEEALEFGRNEPIAAPEVFLTDNARQTSPAKEPLFYSHNVEVPDPVEDHGLRHGENSSYITWWPGNTTDTLILRAKGAAGALTSPDGVEIVERYVVPPRVDITTAEVSGLLHGLKNTRTAPGMFDGSGVRQVPWGGGLPMAVGGEEIEDPPEPEGEVSDPMAMPAAPDENNEQAAEAVDPPAKPARGGVIHNDAKKNATRYPWYPDPLACTLCVMPMRQGVPLLDNPVRVRVLTEAGWPRLSTVLMQLLRNGQQPEQGTVYGDVAAEPTGLVLRLGETKRPFIGRSLPTIGIWLDDGHSCDIALWYAPEDSEALGSHGLVQAACRSPVPLAAMSDSASVSAEARGKILRTLALASPLPGLVNHRMLRLVNAVQKPLTPPTFVPPDADPPVPFVRLNIADKIAEKLDADGGLDPKQATIQSINDFLGGKTLAEKIAEADGPLHDQGATTILFGGKVDIDRPTSSEFRLEARWEDWTDDISRPARRSEPRILNDASDPNFLRPFRPVIKDAWTVLEGTRGTVSNASRLHGTPVDLLRDENGVPRCLIHDFLDTKARRVELRVSAVSRHAGFFAEEGEPDEFVTHGPAYAFDLPATARPAEPVLAADMLPVFSEERVGLISGAAAGSRLNGIRIERKTSLRFFLKRPWLAAGKGQKLALLLWDGALFDADSKSPVDDYQTTPAAIPSAVRPYVSLHGRDPKLVSNSLPDFMTGADILNDLGEERLAHLSLPGVESPKDMREDDYKVSAALFPVVLDRTTDVWLADIAIAARERYMPFVRLSLAACQTNTIPGLELSRPIEAWGRVPPARAASLSVRRPDGNAITDRLRVTVDGGSYWKRDTGPALGEHAAMADAPWLEVFFLQRSADARGSGGWIRADVLQPGAVQASASENGATDHLWDLDIALPPGWNDDAGAENRAVLIREYERIASDAEGPEPAAPDPEHPALQIVEAFATSEDGLSSIVRGKTTFATLVTLKEVFNS